MPTLPKRGRSERMGVRRHYAPELKISFELSGVGIGDTVTSERLQHLDVVSVRKLHITKVDLVDGRQRKTLLTSFIQRPRFGVVPYPGTAVTYLLSRQNLVIEPTAHTAFRHVEREPCGLGLPPVIRCRMQTVIGFGQLRDCSRSAFGVLSHCGPLFP